MPKMKKKHKSRKNIIIFLLIVLFVILLYIVNVFFNVDKITESENNDVVVKVTIDTEKVEASANEAELNKLKEMTERNRIEYYVSQFIKNVEEKKYNEAYEVLNKDFKKNYFSTVKDFKEYSEKRFSKMLNVDYTNFERNGEIYVIWATLIDAINGDPNEEGQQINFVVKEADFNNYELSFSVNY